MRNPKTLLFVIGLFVQTCFSENVETTKQERNTNGKDKKVSKREYYAPEYNHDHYKYPAYRFEYGVHDPHTGDIKKQYEEREGDTVRGYYSLMEPDGSIRLVEYTADSKNGFQAVVKKIGNSHHPTMSVTQHLNTAAGLHDGGGGDGKYAPNYHGGDHHDHHKLTFAPVHNGNYERPAHQQHFQASPPAYNLEPSPPHQAYGDRYHQQQQPPPSAYNHYEPPLVPAHHDQYQQPSPPPAYNHFEPQQPIVNNHFEPQQPIINNHFEPQPVAPVNSHYRPSPVNDHYRPSPAFNHFEPQPVVPVNSHHYEPPVVPVQNNHYESPAPVDHYEPSARPEAADFEHGSAPLFAGSLPTAHGDYGSASPEEYYPAPLHFPATSRENDFDWSTRDDADDRPLHRINVNDDYQFPTSGFPAIVVDEGGDAPHGAAAKAKGGSAERPEYLRKYFEPNYRGNAALSSFYDDDDESK